MENIKAQLGTEASPCLAILERYNGVVRMVSLDGQPKRTFKISDLHCHDIVSLNGHVYVIDCENILRINRDGKPTCLKKLDSSLQSFTQVLSFQDKIYIIQSDGKSMIQFDPKDQTVNKLPGCPLGQGFCCCASEDLIYAMGGYCEQPRNEAKALKYDFRNKEWVDIPRMHFQRRHGASAVLGGQIYVLGGLNNFPPEFYDPPSSTWSGIAKLCNQRAEFSTCVIKNATTGAHQLHAVFGDVENNKQTVEFFNGNQWSIVTEFNLGITSTGNRACIWPPSADNLGSTRIKCQEYSESGKLQLDPAEEMLLNVNENVKADDENDEQHLANHNSLKYERKRSIECLGDNIQGLTEEEKREGEVPLNVNKNVEADDKKVEQHLANHTPMKHERRNSSIQSLGGNIDGLTGEKNGDVSRVSQQFARDLNEHVMQRLRTCKPRFSKSVGREGGSFKLGVAADFNVPKGAVKGNGIATFATQTVVNETDSLTDVAAHVDVQANAEFEQPVEVKLTTFVSGTSTDPVPVVLHERDNPSEEWKQTELLSIGEKNEIEYKIGRPGERRVTIADSSKVKFVYVKEDFYINVEVGLATAVFVTGEDTKSEASESLRDRGYTPFAISPYKFQCNFGTKLTPRMICKTPEQSKIEDDISPKPNFAVDDDFIRKSIEQFYFEFEPKPSDECERVELTYECILDGKRDHKFPLKWSYRSRRNTETGSGGEGDTASFMRDSRLSTCTIQTAVINVGNSRFQQGIDQTQQGPDNHAETDLPQGDVAQNQRPTVADDYDRGQGFDENVTTAMKSDDPAQLQETSFVSRNEENQAVTINQVSEEKAPLVTETGTAMNGRGLCCKFKCVLL